MGVEIFLDDDLFVEGEVFLRVELFLDDFLDLEALPTGELFLDNGAAAGELFAELLFAVDESGSICSGDLSVEFPLDGGTFKLLVVAGASSFLALADEPTLDRSGIEPILDNWSLRTVLKLKSPSS